MHQKIYLPRDVELTEELFSRLTKFMNHQFSKQEKSNIRIWLEERGYLGVIINPNATISTNMFFPTTETGEKFVEKNASSLIFT